MANRTGCAIVGGGPAGMVLGLLLARGGVDVTVLEKHGDFLRDFRGDTVHPTTLRLLDELGLGERFARIPHTTIDQITFPQPDGTQLPFVDLKRLNGKYPYIAMVPQWDLLDLLAAAGAEESHFELRMNAEVTELLRDNGTVTGVRYHDRADDTVHDLSADLTVAADGRWSTVRYAAGMRTHEIPTPFDAWWLRLPRHPEDELISLRPQASAGQFAVAIPREGYYQIAYLAPKGSDAEFRAAGIEAFRRRLAKCVPLLADRVDALESMDDVKHLDVRVNRLRRWHAPGVLCIGDAAHAMSPVGGVGINLAVQDAMAAARILAEPLRTGRVGPHDLAAVRRRRRLPTFLLQSMQRMLHRGVIKPTLEGRRVGPPPLMMALFRRFPGLGAIPAQLVGTGIRSEHAPDFAKRPAV